MSISRDLASKFAKITNDNNKQTEETMYGTVVSQGGKLYVNLDGSDTITPIVTTAEIKPGERVAVMIKGHTATVIGNISNPGASTETTGKILDDYDTIVAKIGDFELIVADKITTEQLEAKLAIIDELIAKKATIEELEAVKATIKDLDVSELHAELAEIEKAVIGKAEIEDLEATHAKIDILEADLADIETLVGGQLTMDNIQSLILTSSKVTVDNAFIKDAMIDRVSASKLAAGTINTNLIQIGSEDGSLAINGSLQQFKDEDGNVRIQIGKDSTGDFTFVLYGEDGKGQLINQNGITASAIGDGLIVNDMVADNAHISGDKLDISSVITEINGSTTTIDSSRIYLDQENKSLSVAFNSLKDTVETIKEVNIEGDFTAALNKIETLTTELNVAKGNINTLVSNTTIVTQDGKTIQMKDDYTATKQTVNSINQTVGSLTTTTKDITSKQTEFKQSLDGFQLEVSENYTTKNELDTTLNTKLDGYYTKKETDSKISVLNGSINMKVGQTELKEAVDGVKVGSTNVLRYTNFDRNDILPHWACTSDNSTISISLYDRDTWGKKLPDDEHIEDKLVMSNWLDIAKAKAANTTNSACYINDFTMKLEANTTYTLSYWMYKSGNCASTHATVWEVKTDGSSRSIGRTPSLTTYTGSFVPQSVTFTTGDNVGVSHHVVIFYNFFNSSLTSGRSDIHIYQPLLTKGSKVVDWSESPLDVEYYDNENTAKLQKNLTQNIEAAVNQGESNVLTTIQGLYAKKDIFESFQSSVTSQFEQTAKDISMQFTNSVTASDTVNGKLEEYKARVDSYIRFSTNGMEMGKSDSPFKSKLTNQKLAFTENGYEVAYISDNKLFITNAEILDILTMGPWVWDVGTNGNLTLNWRG